MRRQPRRELKRDDSVIEEEMREPACVVSSMRADRVRLSR